MCHELPVILLNRVFPVLVLVAKTGPHDFIVVQTPVDIRNVGAAMYSNGRNLEEGDREIKRKRPVLACVSRSLSSQLFAILIAC